MALFDTTRTRLSAAIEQSFYQGVFERKAELEAKLLKLMEGFFQSMVELIGSDETPLEIYFVDGWWQPLTLKWLKEKRAKGSSQGFYSGKRRGRPRSQYLATTLGQAKAIEMYGAPIVDVTLGGKVLSGSDFREGTTFVDPKGRTRFLRGYPSRKDPSLPFDPRNARQPGEKRGRGNQFATTFASLHASLIVNMFPKVLGTFSGIGPAEPSLLYTAFSGTEKAVVKLMAGDNGTFNRPARPFLSGMMKYYVEVKANQVVQEFLRGK